MSAMKDPCISICKFNDDICVGCGRSKREIRAWKKLDKADKRTVLAEAELRLLALGPPVGGKANELGVIG